jgi:hypothetical protein
VRADVRKTNRYLEALKEHFNVVGMASAAALSAATLNPLPLLVGLVAEAAYLAFVPDSKWYEARLARRFDAEVERRREELKQQLFPLLRPELQERFLRLEETRRQISEQSLGDQKWFREVLRKLDYLLERFLQFAAKEAQFRQYLASVRQEQRGAPARTPPPARESRGRRGGPGPSRLPETAMDWVLAAGRGQPGPESNRWVEGTVGEIQEHYDRETEEVRLLIEKEPDVNTKAVLEKRLEVLQRRHEFVGKMGRILTNLNHQIQLLEETFGLINDEIRARSPEQVLADIEDVVWQTNTMTQLLEEIAPYEQMVARLG